MDKNWLQELLDELDYKQADLVRRSHIDSAVISNILNDRRKAGIDTCLKIAEATGRPPVEILRRAGLLPAVSKNDELTTRAMHVLESLKRPENKKMALTVLESLYQQEKGNTDAIQNLEVSK